MHRLLTASYVVWNSTGAGPLPPIPNDINDIKKELNPKSVAEGTPRSVVNALCESSGTTAWAAVGGGHGGWTLTGVSHGSVDLGDGSWIPVDGVSLEMTHTDLPADVQAFLSVHPVPADRTKSCIATFINTQNIPVTGIALHYSKTRTVDPQGKPGHDAVVLPPHYSSRSSPWDLESLDVRYFEVPARPGERVAVQLAFRGDPPHVRGFTWLAANAPEVSAFGPFAPLPDMVTNPSLLSGFHRNYEQEFYERRMRIAADPVPKRREFKEFFLDLELETMPASPYVPAPLVADIRGLGGYLTSRFFARAEDPTWSPSAQELATWRRPAIHVAHHLEGIFLWHFRKDLENLTRNAFHAFAGGELGVLDSHGVPNGVNYFSFGELCLLLEELKCDMSFWDLVSPALLESAEIFVNGFHAPGGGRTTCAYRPMYNPDGARHYDPAMKTRLTSDWSAAGHRTEFGRLVHAALVGETSATSPPAKALDDTPPF